MRMYQLDITIDPATEIDPACAVLLQDENTILISFDQLPAIIKEFQRILKQRGSTE